MGVFNPWDEPEDRFGLNDHGVSAVDVLIGLIPAVGAGVALGLFWYAVGVDDNPFNLANAAWNTAVLVTAIQVLYAIIIVLWVVL